MGNTDIEKLKVQLEKTPPVPQDATVDVEVEITWDDESPVVGARVYEHVPNSFLGTTGEDGKLSFKSKNGTIIRLVEPEYGIQQALRTVSAKYNAAGDNYVAGMGEGWTL